MLFRGHICNNSGKVIRYSMTTNNYISLYRKYDRVVQDVLFKVVFNAIVKQLDGRQIYV